MLKEEKKLVIKYRKKILLIKKIIIIQKYQLEIGFVNMSLGTKKQILLQNK